MTDTEDRYDIQGLAPPPKQGARFGLLVLTSGPIRRTGHTYFEAICDCGNAVQPRRDVLVKGRSRSCGCIAPRKSAEKNTKHGCSIKGAESPEYCTWRMMLDRCRNPNNKRYNRYGGRGIRVCERWHDFINFLADMGKRPTGMTIDRIDNDGNYELTNCRWATDMEQRANRQYGKKAA